MADSYTQTYIHIVFSTKGRVPVLRSEHKEELHKYISGIIAHKGHKLLALNSMSDHVHLFMDLNPNSSLTDAVRDIKANSSAFINKKRWIVGRFNWQEGYGAFSYSHSQRSAVIRYIANQEQHHKKKDFRQEYLDILKKFDISYSADYAVDDR
jgi:REP element-mobilizing transposase RayT